MIFIQLKEQLQILSALLQRTNEADYKKKILHLDGATIGQHTRHIIELLQCAEQAKITGVVDYVNRTRNLSLENNCALAIETIEQLISKLSPIDMELKFEINEYEAETTDKCIGTTYFREIVYNTEHITHHLALIKVALIELGISIENPTFGYSYATLQYRKQLAEEE
jgi:hypothetical protein